MAGGEADAFGGGDFGRGGREAFSGNLNASKGFVGQTQAQRDKVGRQSAAAVANAEEAQANAIAAAKSSPTGSLFDSDGNELGPTAAGQAAFDSAIAAAKAAAANPFGLSMGGKGPGPGQGRGIGGGIIGAGQLGTEAEAGAELGGLQGGGAEGPGTGKGAICTQLLSENLLSSHLYSANTVYHKNTSSQEIKGYHYWALPVVRKMKQYPWIGKLLKPFVLARSKELLHILNSEKPSNYFGKVINIFINSINKILGKFV